MWNLKKKNIYLKLLTTTKKKQTDRHRGQSHASQWGGQDRGGRMRGTGCWASGRLEDLLCKMGDTASLKKIIITVNGK